MDVDPGIELVHQFFPGTGATYDHIANLCTIGFDRWWKRKIVEKIPIESTRIMDQACGTGILTLKIARKFPHALIIGVDVTEEYLAIAKEKAARMSLDNVHFILGRAEDVLLDQKFDCVMSSYLAKYARLGSLIRNVKNMLKGAGTLVMHDFTYPSNHAFACLWEIYFKLLQTAGAWKYPQWRAVFDGLPGLLRETRWTDELVESLLENGFSEITKEPLTCDTSAIVTARRA
jgi:demethylmenaquinone methyltransferase / 2-methoxy-6-polyprenyl-1,4-benzoquinol methylase